MSRCSLSSSSDPSHDPGAHTNVNNWTWLAALDAVIACTVHSSGGLALEDAVQKTWHGPLVSERDPAARALSLAARIGDSEYVRAHATRESVTDVGLVRYIFNPAAAAAFNGHLKILEFLIDECEADESCLRAALAAGAGMAGRREVAEMIFARRPDWCRDPDFLRQAVLEAAAFGHFEVLVLLVSYVDVAGVDERLEAHLQRALYRACEGGHVAVVKFLLQRGVNVREIRGPFGFHGSCLHAAAKGGHAEVVALLVPAIGSDFLGFSYDRENENFKYAPNDPLAEAARCGHVPVACVLLQNGAEVEGYYCTEKVRTPLFGAIASEQYPMVELLLDSGACIDGDVGAEALNIAKRCCGESMVKLLVERGCRVPGLLKDGPSLVRAVMDSGD